MTSASTPPSAGHVSRRKFVRLTVLIMLAMGAVGLAYALLVGGAHSRTKRPPNVELAGLDAEAAAAIRAARADVEARPRSGEAWGRLGMVLLANDLQPESLTCFEEAERLDPADARWPYHQGSTLVALGRPDAALAPLRQSAERDRSETAARLVLAETLLALDRPDEAEPLLRELLAAHPESARVHLGLGQIAARRGQLRASLNDLQEAADSPYCRRAARAALADVYERLGETDAAATERQHLPELPPDPPWPDAWRDEVEALRRGLSARLQRAEQILACGKVHEALELMAEVAHDHPESDEPHQAMASALLTLDRLEAAEAHTRLAIRLRPESVDNHLLLGEVRKRRHDEPGAEKCYRRALELKPDHAAAHYGLGQCRQRQHDPAGAAAEFRLALRYRPEMTEAHVALAEVLLEQGQPAEARGHLEDALRLAPGHEKARLLLKKVK
jgi:tetratricopeptide (TPR) repeat protein